MIKLFLTDLDGTLTDGTYFIFSDPKNVGKRFYTRDFWGMRILHERGVEAGIVTLSTDEIIQNQLDRLKNVMDITLFPRCVNKYDTIKKHYIDSGKFLWRDIAFIGDDVNDLELLNIVGVAACPKDAEPEVIDLINKRQLDGFVMSKAGGNGCVREFINLLIV